MKTGSIESTRTFVGIQQDGEVWVDPETGRIVQAGEKADFPVVVGVRVAEVTAEDAKTMLAVHRHFARVWENAHD